MSVLKVDLLSKESMLLAIGVISLVMNGNATDSAEVSARQEAIAVDTPDEVVAEDDGMGDLGDLLGEEAAPEGVTVEDMKASVSGLMDAVCKDAAIAFVKKAFAKMKVAKMDEIPEDKRELFIGIVDKQAAK